MAYPHIETTDDYKQFQESVDHYMKGLYPSGSGPASCCPDCQEIYGLDEDSDLWEECIDEGGFSWSPCDCCDRSLGGDRYIQHAFGTNENGSINLDESYHLSVCTDCMYYLEYGQLDDMTMIDMKES